ncbi:hypothetical protein E2320_006372, partial [Naja naja]
RREGRAPTEPPPSETAASGRVATAGKRRRGRGGRLGCFRWRPMDGQIGGGDVCGSRLVKTASCGFLSEAWIALHRNRSGQNGQIPMEKRSSLRLLLHCDPRTPFFTPCAACTIYSKFHILEISNRHLCMPA